MSISFQALTLFPLARLDGGRSKPSLSMQSTFRLYGEHLPELDSVSGDSEAA